MLTASRSLALAVMAALVLAAAADAAVLCAHRRRDGSLGTTVKLRAACRPAEVTLTPEALGFCCTATTTTTTTTEACPTTTTLGLPNCGGQPPSCAGLCPDSQQCGANASGQCACSGPLHCGGADHFCGGDCPAGQSCQQLPVPAGCGSIGCGCQ